MDSVTFSYHEFKHGFLDAIAPLCRCSTVMENTIHYFLHCPKFSTAENTFLNKIANVDKSIIDQDEIKIIQIFFMVIQLILSMKTCINQV